MGEFTDKTKAFGNKISGSTKEGLGKAFDDPDLIAKGKLQQAKGDAQEAAGEIKGALGDKF